MARMHNSLTKLVNRKIGIEKTLIKVRSEMRAELADASPEEEPKKNPRLPQAKFMLTRHLFIHEQVVIT